MDKSSTQSAAMRTLVLVILQLYFAEGFLPRPPQVYLPADDGDPGLPLILTPYIERGDITQARKLSEVSLPGIQLHVPSHAGFLTVNSTYNSNLFFWYFPNQSYMISKNCVVLWLQGGPGASSLFGLFQEHGPIQVMYTNGTYSLMQRTPNWALTCHLLYIDNPVGAGFSFTEDVRGFSKNQIQVGEQLYSALIQFSELFPELQPYKFLLTGESYAGKYIPALGHIIHEKNPSARIKINLHGMLIGNGWCDPVNQLLYHKHGYHLGYIGEHDALQIKAMEWKTGYYIKNNNWLRASQTNQIMFRYIESAYKLGLDVNFNFYNILEDAVEPPYFINYVNKNAIRRAIHVGDTQFNPVSQTVYHHLKPDILKSVAPLISELLGHYKIVFYSGLLDLVVPYSSTVNFLRKLDFADRVSYLTATRNNFNPWNYFLKTYSKVSRNLTEIALVKAGHQVAKDIQLDPLFFMMFNSDVNQS